MRYLLIDNSNTRTKLVLSTEKTLGDWKEVLPTSEISEESLTEVLEGVEFDRVVICSVVPEKAEVLRGFFSEPTHLISSESTLSIDIDYPKPEQIGADRLANSVAAFHKYGSPTVVIDSGTAVTFDIIKVPKCYCGGVIAPGLGLMTSYFIEKTALLPELQPEEPASFIGKSTLEAMNIGALVGFRGLIREILTGVTEELGQVPNVIATGGDAELLFHGIKRIDCLDPDLTMEGILEIGLLNFD